MKLVRTIHLEAFAIGTLSVCRDAVRSLLGGRGTTVVVLCVLTLATAVGTATFSVVYGVALRPLPFSSPDRLVDVATAGSTGSPGLLSPEEYFSLADSANAFALLGAARLTGPSDVEVEATIESMVTRLVTVSLFEALGVRAAVGQLFQAEHGKPGGGAAVVLSHETWVRRFGGSSSAVGQWILVGGTRREIIGVLPEGVGYPVTPGVPAELYVPWVPTAADRSNGVARSLSVVGRLLPDVTLAQAQADVSRVGPAVARPLHDRVVGSARDWLFLVLAAVVFLVLVAWVNVANLLLARSARRLREFATLEALGASRRRIVTVLLVEGLLLVGLAAVAGSLLSLGLVEFARANLPPALMRTSSIAVDGRVLAITIGFGVLCGGLFTGAPAWMTARLDLMRLLRDDCGPIVGSRSRHRALRVLLGGSFAFVCLLLVATTLVVITFVSVSTADLGFDHSRTMYFRYEHQFRHLPRSGYQAAATALRTELLSRAVGAPGVRAAAIAMNSGGRMSLGGPRYSMTIPGRPALEQGDWLETNMVTPDYFDVMGIEVVRGRGFLPTDRFGAPPVMVINEAAARMFFQGRDPIGVVVSVFEPVAIVGVLRSVRYDGPESTERPAMYLSLDQVPYFEGVSNAGALFLSTFTDPRGVSGKIQVALGPTLGTYRGAAPVYLSERFEELIAVRRSNAYVMGLFGLVAAIVSAIGVYGTVSYFVAQQVPAIGLKMALGAAPNDVRRQVIVDTLRIAALGISLGLFGAVACSKFLGPFVVGLRATEPSVFVGVAMLLIGVALIAALGPATRAARVDPLRALGLR